MFIRNLVLFLYLGISAIAYSQDKDTWVVSDPVEPFTEVTINTDEGTWMNLDVSPDGKLMVFDLLGDIYTLPINGGAANLIRGGHAYEVQPRFSPDGSKIAFTSDYGGGDNIWIMNVDGSDATQVTKEDFRLLNNPAWTPDGNYLVARKHFTSRRSLGAGELWMYHISGGKGIQLTKRKNDQQDAGEPVVSPDGKSVYYSEDMYPGGYFQYNKDPNSQIYVIRKYKMDDGTVETVIRGPGGAVRPQISPDGKKLAFVRRVRTKSVLYIHDLESGIQKPVYDKLSKDQQEAWAIFGVYPNYNWMPDNLHVVVWAEGKLWKVNTETGEDQEIPFTASATHRITTPPEVKIDPAPESFKAHVLRGVQTAPDGKSIVFNAAGRLYTKSLPNGTPKRLTRGNDLEFEPSYSPDGKSILFVTWNDETKGAIMRVPAKGGEPVKISSEPGMYRNPKYSADGSKIVYYKERGNLAMGFAYTSNPGIYWMSADGNNPTWVTNDGQMPVFNGTGDRIFYLKGGFLFGSLDKSFKSINLDGEDERTHFHSKYANQYAVSPDGNWLAFGELYQVYIMPFKDVGKTFELKASDTSLPIRKVSDNSGINLHWNPEGNKLNWSLGQEYFSVELDQVFTFVDGAPDSIPEVTASQTSVDLTLELDVPEGVLAFTGARIITMNGDEVIENGDVVVEGNRIVAVGASGSVNIPGKATVIDASGKVIMPGIIDVHAHLNAFRYGLSPQKEWPYYANLAYGITSTHDPSSNSEMSLSQSEMVKSGVMVGPRIFTTGTILYGADGDFKAVINSYQDAENAIARTKAYGAFSVKSYNQPRREQRQQVIKAAKKLDIRVYPEGGSTFFHNMTMVLDGHNSVEHNIPVAPLYKDVVSLWGASKTANCPTLIVNYGGLNGEYYWYQTTNVWENEKLLNFTPRAIIDSRSRHRTMAPMEEYDNGHILVSQSVKKLADAGVVIGVGGHGQLQGLGVHWEMWNLSQGGMTNMQVLKSATIDGARYIGMEDHLGSIESGKLADLIILEKDPLENIQNSISVTHTLINGRLYDTESMNETGNTDVPRTRFYWELEGYNDNFDWHAETHDFMGVRCVCQH